MHVRNIYYFYILSVNITFINNFKKKQLAITNKNV